MFGETQRRVDAKGADDVGIIRVAQEACCECRLGESVVCSTRLVP